MNVIDIERLDRGPHVVAYRTLVHSNTHDLFAVVANPHRHHEFDGSGTVEPQVIGPRELRLGDRFRVSMRLGKVPYAITSTVVDLVADRVIEWRHPGGHSWRWEFDPQHEGHTVVTEAFDYSKVRFPSIYELIRAPERNTRSIRGSLLTLQRLDLG